MPDMKTLTINGVQYNIVDPNARPADWMPTAEQVGARANDWMPTAEEVGARANTWLPTIAEIGAAPAGFGFGEQAIELSSGLLKSEAELDTALETIYSKMENSETKLIRFAGYPDNSDYNWYGFLFRSSANYGSLIMQSAYAKGSLISKAKYESTWQPLEWVNPPMNVGVEYRTTERYNGKAVYAKAINFGTLPNKTTSYIESAITVDCTYVVSLTGTRFTGASARPLGEMQSAGWCAFYINQYGNLFVETDWDMSGSTAIIIAKYTKD